MMYDDGKAKKKASRMARGHFRLCGFDVDVEEEEEMVQSS